MKKIRRIRVVCMLCGLILAMLLLGTGSVQALSLDLQPVQVKNTGYISAKGTVTVSATCPQNYHVQSGNVEISGYNSTGETPRYSVEANGPDAQVNGWTATVVNPLAGSLDITVMAMCAAAA